MRVNTWLHHAVADWVVVPDEPLKPTATLTITGNNFSVQDAGSCKVSVAGEIRPLNIDYDHVEGTISFEETISDIPQVQGF